MVIRFPLFPSRLTGQVNLVNVIIQKTREYNWIKVQIIEIFTSPSMAVIIENKLLWLRKYKFDRNFKTALQKERYSIPSRGVWEGFPSPDTFPNLSIFFFLKLAPFSSLSVRGQGAFSAMICVHVSRDPWGRALFMCWLTNSIFSSLNYLSNVLSHFFVRLYEGCLKKIQA